MTHLLHLTASPRGSASHSRRISNEFIETWLQTHPGDTVTLRDIGHQNIPYVTEDFVGALYTPAGHRTPAQMDLLTLSDELIGELRAADLYVFSMPMYNFSVPAVFKAYIDQIVRIGVTVTARYEGLLKNKKVVFITARGGGGYGPGEARAAYNFEDPYLRIAMSTLGVTDQTFIHLTNMSNGDEAPRSLAAARAQLKKIAGAK